jgi:hypothetical protein
LKDPPDFEIQIGDNVEPFELTEAHEPEMKRGDEYKEAAEKAAVHGGVHAEDDPEEDWIARAHQIPGALRRASERKASKYYEDVNLLIYLNIDEWGIRHNAIVRCFPRCTAGAGLSFASVWIFWKGAAYQVWRGGCRASDVLYPRRRPPYAG